MYYIISRQVMNINRHVMNIKRIVMKYIVLYLVL